MVDVSEYDINVVDAYPGWGKSTRMIKKIKNDQTSCKYLVITPYLTEAHRYAGTDYKQQTGSGKKVVTLPIMKDNKFVYNESEFACYPPREFKHPMNFGKGKVDSLKKLIYGNYDIVGTHALFSYLNQEIYELLSCKNYHLVIDECIDVVTKYDKLTAKQINKLFERDHLYREEDGTVRWDKLDYDLKDKDALFPDIKRLADNGNLISPFDSNKMLLWRFPLDFLSCFNKVHILTYRFENSLMDLYFKKYGIETKIRVHKPDIAQIKENINLIDNKRMNNISLKSKAFSKNSYVKDIKSNNKAMSSQVKKSMTNFVKNICKARTERVMWTSFKEHIPYLKGQGYSKKECWLPLNSRATNEYASRDVVMYTVNRYMNPYIVKFLGVSSESEDFWALSELIQFIWRSAIRDDKKIDVYIVSTRMRNLLIDWLDGK